MPFTLLVQQSLQTIYSTAVPKVGDGSLNCIASLILLKTDKMSNILTQALTQVLWTNEVMLPTMKPA